MTTIFTAFPLHRHASMLVLGALTASVLQGVGGAAEPASAENTQVAQASTQAKTGTEEIVVTAQKRSESVQRVPASITAIGAVEIKDARINNAVDLPRIAPSVNVSNYFGSVQINIRGLGLTSPNPMGEASVLTYVDGVYLARPTAIGAAFDDLSRIEVLRGPQGTLYGRNATGGVVNLITREPGDEVAANISATYGSYDRFKLTGGVEGPLTDKTSARVAFYHETHDGSQINDYTGERVNDFRGNGVRATVKTNAIDSLTLILRGDYYEDKVHGVNYDEIIGSENPGANPFGSVPSNPSGVFPIVTVPAAGPLFNDGKHVSFDAPDPTLGHRNLGVSLTADWDINENISLKSITAYRYSLLERGQQDYDGTSSPIIQEAYAHEGSKAFTQELDLTGKTDGGITYVVGAYYFHEDLELHYLYNIYAQALLANYALGLPPGTVPNTFFDDDKANTQSVSAFAQVTVPLTDQIKLTGGIRKNYDKKDQLQDIVVFGSNICGGPALSKGKWDDLTWKVGLDYQVTPTNLLYASVSKGFKAGGLNLSACDAQYDPESVISYEVGSKNRFLDGKVLLNISAFYYDYTDLQVNVFTATTTVTQNSSSANVYGGEMELKVIPVDNLELSGSLSLLHAEYDGYVSVNPLAVGTGAGPEDLTGNQIANTSKVLANLSAQYTIPIDDNALKLRYDLRYNSGFFGDAFHNFGSHQPAFAVHNARIAYDFQKYEVGVFVDNFTNKIYADNRYTFGTGGNVLAVWAPRRTFGVFVNADF